MTGLRNKVRVALVVGFALLGCAGWYAHSAFGRVSVEPGLAIVDVGTGSLLEVAGAVLGGELPPLKLTVELTLRSQNLMALSVRRCTWRISVREVVIARGVLDKPVRLPPDERVRLRFDARVDLKKIGPAALGALRRLTPDLSVEVEVVGRAMGVPIRHRFQIDGFTLRPRVGTLR